MHRDALIEIKGEAKVQWSHLTDADIDRLDGTAEQLVSLIQERYAYSRDRAQREVVDFLRRTQHVRI